MILPYSRIHLNTVPERYEGEALLQVLPDSPVRLRREVERLAVYFRRELHYDFTQFAYNETNANYTAYLFASRFSIPPVWAGACCFRPRYYDDVGRDIPSLDWIWMHPFFRREGLLRTQWNTLRQNHGDFFVGRPLSDGMRAFLRSHNGDSEWSNCYGIHDGDDA